MVRESPYKVYTDYTTENLRHIHAKREYRVITLHETNGVYIYSILSSSGRESLVQHNFSFRREIFGIDRDLSKLT